MWESFWVTAEGAAWVEQAALLTGELIKSGSVWVCLKNVLLCALSERSPTAIVSLLVSVCHGFDLS